MKEWRAGNSWGKHWIVPRIKFREDGKDKFTERLNLTIPLEAFWNIRTKKIQCWLHVVETVYPGKILWFFYPGGVLIPLNPGLEGLVGLMSRLRLTQPIAISWYERCWRRLSRRRGQRRKFLSKQILELDLLIFEDDIDKDWLNSILTLIHGKAESFYFNMEVIICGDQVPQQLVSRMFQVLFFRGRILLVISQGDGSIDGGSRLH